MSNCIGMPRYEVEANMAALFGDRLSKHGEQLTESEVESMRVQFSLERMISREVFFECPTHAGYYLSPITRFICDIWGK